MDTRRPTRAGLTAAATALAATSGYLLVLLAAAGARRRPASAPRAAGTRFLVLVPAHDEEPVIAATLAALAAMDGPAESREVVVVADHCTDATAAVAARAGVTVLERDDGDAGKGAALAWALEQLGARLERFDAVAVVDADCAPTPNLLEALAASLAGGAEAAQADYVVANPEESTASALRFAAFRLVNTVRPLGKEALGLSVGLNGTGMAFSRAALDRVPWRTTTVVEDAEQHLALVAAGERVAFAADAAVLSPMPTSLRASERQQERWEASRVDLVRRWLPPLVRGALRERDRVRAHAALELLVPAQSLLLAGGVATASLALALRERRALGLAIGALAGQVTFVVGGLALVRAPASVWRALLHAPLLAAQKLRIVGRMAVRGGPSTFVRTDRG